jgi:RHS repeat-associated protein
VTVTRGNGITTKNSYKPASGNFRLSQALVKDGSSNLMGQAYGYDKVGNITSITDQVATDVQSFTYDPLNRLSTASGTLSAAAYDWRYGYEESGNIDYVVKDGQTTDYGYSAAQHQAVEELIVGGEPVGSFAYDANGNMISRTITDTVTTTYTQEFDVENRLITVTVGSEVTVFAYDAGGQRVMTVEPDGTVIYTPFSTYEEEVASGGATTIRSYYLSGGRPVALRVNSTPSDPDDGLYFIHGDHLGSTSLLTDAAGTPKGDLVRYYPFGEYRVGPTTELTDRGYTGQQENSYIKLIDMRSRWYDPAIGRFISADTIVPDPGNPQSYNRYTYTYNNPVKYNDPSGHYTCHYIEGECSPAAGSDVPYSDRYYFSSTYGWFDSSHFNTGQPAEIIQGVREAVANGGGMVIIDQDLGPSTYMGEYWVSGDVSGKELLGVAYGIYEHWSIGFEEWQDRAYLGLLDAWSASSFAIEDLPSNRLGFFMNAAGLTREETLSLLGGVTATDSVPHFIFPENGMDLGVPPYAPNNRIERIYNKEFTPLVPSGNQLQRVPFPEPLTITPISAESGLWEFRGESAKYFCLP